MKTEICFFKISNNAFAADKLPARLKLLNWGENKTVKGPVRVGDKTLAVFSANQKEAGFDRVALDFEHNTLPGTPAFLAENEPRKVAAYGVPRVIAGDGLYLEDLQWTPSGKEYAREYYDLSPGVKLDCSEVIFMHSTALCRQGAVEDLHFYSVEISNINKETTVDPKKLLLELLALNADATDDQVKAAIAARIKSDAAAATALTALTTQVKDLAAKITTLSLPGEAPGAKTGAGEITALTAKVAVLESNVINFSAELAKRDRSALVDQAGREGKVIPLTAEQIATMPIPVLGDMIAKLPVTVPLTALTASGIREQPMGNVVTENDKRIAANCGIKLPEAK